MSKTTDDLVRIAMVGGGMKISAKGKTTDQLTRIALTASEKKSRVIIMNASHKTTDDLVRIAMAGKGCVIFDLITE